MKPAVVTFGSEDFATTIRIGAHTLTADATPEAGGLDTGPEPHDLLAAALASCTSMTLRMYAKRKGWDVSGLEVTVAAAKDASGATVFSRSLTFGAAVDAEQRTRLTQIANACPVHKILSGTLRIETSTVGEQPRLAAEG